MSFQTTVNFQRALGVPGDIIFSGPTRAEPAILHSADAAYNIVGATAFTVETAGSDSLPPAVPIVAAAGGTGVFAGILVNPHVYASGGTTGGGPLAPTMTLPNYVNAELLTMGQIIITVPAACTVGDRILYDTTTGALSTQAPTATFTGVVATSGGVDTLTVSSASAGLNLGLGSVVTGTGVLPNTYVKALGSGTGGNGTYVLSTSGVAVSSTTMTGVNAAPSGKAFVPNAVISRYQATTSGLAVATLTNPTT